MQHGLHHVQADAATRDLGDLGGGAESGPEHQSENFSFSQSLRLFRGKETLFDGFGFDFLNINSRAIVGDFNDNLIAVMIRSELDGSTRRLPVSDSLFGALNAMTDGIADEMGHRLGNDIEQTLVEIGLLTLHHQGHFLTALLGYVSHHSGKAPEQLLDRDHANFHD